MIMLCSFISISAQNTDHASLRSVISAVDNLQRRRPADKLYLHLDKPYYVPGDTMRFKAYLLDEKLWSNTHSGLFYVELINDSSRVIKRQTIMLFNGVAVGDIVLKKTLYPGNYIMRAFTNWMRNFSEEHFFTRQITIAPAIRQYWLVSKQVTLKNKNVNLALQLTDLEHKNIGFKDVQFSILQGTSTLLKNKIKTDGYGKLAINFDLPVKLNNKPLTLLIEDLSKEGKKITVPIQLNQPENTDLQFMPEGGNLIAGIITRIGFKAIGEDGKSVAISGKVYDSQQQQVAVFKSAHKGMGSFILKPQIGEKYTAKITLPDDSVKSYPLPTVNETGIALKVEVGKTDSISLTLSATANLLTGGTIYYLIGLAREKVCYGATIVFKGKDNYKIIPKSIFPTGIVKFVLFDANNRPVTQRLVFIDHDDLLRIAITQNKESYLLRDSIAMQLSVMDGSGNPVTGNFSLAVTDDKQVKADDEDAENIASHMLLNADLNGNIEQAGYYFNKEHADRIDALDKLMLTQGWAGYDWKPAFGEPEELPYVAETKFTARGRVSNILGLPINNTEIMLISSHPQLFLTTRSNMHGRFEFSDFPLMDTMNFHIQAKRGFNVGVLMDAFIPPEIIPAKFEPTPWYVNTDSTFSGYMNNNIRKAESEESLNLGKSKLLKEVVIKGRRPEPPGVVALLMTEEDLRNARATKKSLSLLKLLHQKFPGVLAGGVLVDGRTPDVGWGPTPEGFLSQVNTDDIKGFTVIKYKKSLSVRVTSNAGNGEILSGIYGYAYRPMPISWPHRVYSPRYTVKTPGNVKDMRSTIFWAGNITTDSLGKAAGSFYSADMPGAYTVIVQGADLNGNIGYQRQKIKIVSDTIARQ
jgi:hypothetical protein